MQNGVHCGFKGQDTISMVHSFMLDHNFAKSHTNTEKNSLGEDLEEVAGESRLSTRSSLSGKSGISATPSLTQEKWKRSLCSLLNDCEGVKAFQTYLQECDQESTLICLLAMKGFRNFGMKENIPNSGNSSAASSTTGSITNKSMTLMDEETKRKRLRLAHQIYCKFLGSDAPKSVSNIITQDTKQKIVTSIKNAVKKKSGVELDIFHEAKSQIELYVESTFYRSFLASDNFFEYISISDTTNKSPSNGQPPQPNSIQTSISSQSNVQHPVDATNDQKISTQPGYLPRLDENQVWNPTRKNISTNVRSHPSDSLKRTAIIRSVRENHISVDHDESHRQDVNRPAAPYYTANTYWVPPASAIGSDQASKSSDATSDTLSCPDNSSIDGATAYSSSRTGHKRYIRNQMKKNPANVLPECCHQPRTTRCKDIPTLATNNPAAFFEQLRIKLEKVLEEQKRVRAMMQRNNEPNVFDEDIDEMMESHIARVIHSPGEHNIPPILSSTRLPISASTSYPQHKTESSISENQRMSGVVKKDQLRRKPEVPAVGLVPGMAQNEVPDIPTPVNPVDKNQMICAWIQQAPSSNQSRKKHQKMRRSVATDNEIIPGGMPILPEDRTGLTSTLSSTRPHRTPLVLAQDMMPPMEQPDVNTTIEEVKRRLIEETDRNEFSPIHSAETHESKAVVHESVSDTDSSTETATSANTISGKVDTSNEANNTTVVYYLPHEPLAYKIHIPHCPLTLGQFKSYLTKRNNQKFFFKHFSPELKRDVFFEVTKDNEKLPLWEDVVLAKIEYEL
ncbi:axin protein [Ciona intestinalis]